MKVVINSNSLSPQEALDLVAGIIHAQIQHHEKFLVAKSDGENTELRKENIRQLQKNLFELRHAISDKASRAEVTTVISVSSPG